MILWYCFQDVGYNHGKTYFDGMMKGGLPLHGGPPYASQNPYLGKVTQSTRTKVQSHERSHSGAYNFTDLAQMVCKVRKNMVPVAGTDDGELNNFWVSNYNRFDCNFPCFCLCSDYSDDDTDYPEGGYCSEPGIEFIRSATSSKVKS